MHWCTSLSCRSRVPIPRKSRSVGQHVRCAHGRSRNRGRRLVTVCGRRLSFTQQAPCNDGSHPDHPDTHHRRHDNRAASAVCVCHGRQFAAGDCRNLRAGLLARKTSACNARLGLCRQSNDIRAPACRATVRPSCTYSPQHRTTRQTRSAFCRGAQTGGSCISGESVRRRSSTHCGARTRRYRTHTLRSLEAQRRFTGETARRGPAGQHRLARCIGWSRFCA